MGGGQKRSFFRFVLRGGSAVGGKKLECFLMGDGVGCKCRMWQVFPVASF